MNSYSRIAIFRKPGEPVRVTETAIPEPREGEILVKVLYTTLCRSDIFTYTGKRKEKSPTILGHEVVGIICKKGEGSPMTDERGIPINIGDRITWAIYSSNPECPLSKRGMPQKAEGLFKYGHELITPDSTLHGGLSDYILLRKNTPVVKPADKVPDSIAATINCAMATAAATLREAGEIAGRNVGIVGVGMLGTVACAMCRVRGASSITVFDISDDRLERAGQFGADQEFNLEELSSDEEFMYKADVILEFSGSPDAIEKSLDFLAVGGVVVWAGAVFPQRDVSLNAEKILRNLNTIKGVHNYTNHDLVTAVGFIEEYFSEFPFSQLIEAEFSLEEVNEAFRYAVTANPYRVGINLSGNVVRVELNKLPIT